MKIGAFRRIERLEVRYRMAQIQPGAHLLTDEEIDGEFRAMLTGLRTMEGSKADAAFYDAVLALSGLTFSRVSYFVFLVLHAVESGDVAERQRATQRLEGRLREEAPLAWAAFRPAGRSDPDPESPADAEGDGR